MMSPSSRILSGWLIPCCLAIAAGLAEPSARAMEPPALVRVMSFNIRYGTANDGDNRWELRREFLAETVLQYDPDLLGTQETLADQRDFLLQKMAGYEAVAAGRDDGREAGEMAALFYRKERFEPLNSGHFWLSETPDQVGSQGWDAALPRIATWVKLRDLRMPDASPILFLNTHFDHRGVQARAESAKLIRRKLQELGENCRWIVTGDFNADPKDPPYTHLFATDLPSHRDLIDSYRAHRPSPSSGEGTFSGFDAKQIEGARIDWIGCSPDFEVRLAHIDRTSFEGRTPSDHFPVTAVLRPKLPETEGTLRVMTYNIHHGEGMDGVLDLIRISALVRRWDPDLVALQEVDRGTRRSALVDQAAALSRGTDMEGTFFRAIDFDEGQYGQAVLSRVPIAKSDSFLLPNEGNREQRIAAEAFAPFGDRTIRLVTTHLDPGDSTLRLQQAEALVDRYRASELPVILTGDLNATPESPVLKRLAEVWVTSDPPGVHPTFPANQPTTRIDYVLTRNRDALFVQELIAIEEPLASDHRPVLAILKWR